MPRREGSKEAGMVRIDRVRDLGLLVRDRRRRLGMSQAELAGAAGVSRRWLSSLEAGKPTAEISLVMRTLAVVGLVLDATPEEDRPRSPHYVDLDAHLRDLRRDLPERDDHPDA
jgi:HTH-type transcriptional regulator/antitoxin HipB